MSDLMSRIEAAPDDPLLGLMMAARADERPNKVDLSVGIYKDTTGATPVMQAVRDVEAVIQRDQVTKAYESPRGNPVYGEAIEHLAFGGRSDRRVTFATPGGSGALFVAMRTARLLSPNGSIWIGAPAWPNHNGIAKAVGLAEQSFPYTAAEDGRADLGPIEAALAAAKPGDVVLLQGACHNPTGTDLSPESWEKLASLVVEKQVLPLIDVAYQGFALGLSEDMAPIRAFLDNVPEALVTYSCSKNFGLYRERCGALFVQGPNQKTVEVVASQVASVVRSCYSMPPAHGPAIVAGVLTDDALRANWLGELSSMRERLILLRANFANALAAASGLNSLQTIAAGHGMFSKLPIAVDATKRLQTDEGIYMPGSGRVNLAGLEETTITETAVRIAPYLNQAS